MRKKILVIDDDEDILSILEIILGEEGYEPILLNTGTTADEVKRIYPDLILLDIRIAGYPRSGVDICTEFKGTNEILGIPVLLISAEDNIETLTNQCGANGFVKKPFDIFGLVNKVKEFIT